MELCNTESSYGFVQRIVGVESSISLVQQFNQLRSYMEHLLPSNDRVALRDFLDITTEYITDLRKPIFMCVTARAIDLQNVLTSMAKVKWDVNHVNVEHSSYVDNLNRVSENSVFIIDKLAHSPIAFLSGRAIIPDAIIRDKWNRPSACNSGMG